MEISLEWKIAVGRRRFASGHSRVGDEKENRNSNGRIKFMRIRKMEEVKTEERHLWNLSLDRPLLSL